MVEIPKGVVPVWNLEVWRCGPDPKCPYYENGTCSHINEISDYKGQILKCPNPECIKRKIVDYEEIKSVKSRTKISECQLSEESLVSEKSKEIDMKIIDHCHCPATRKSDGEMVEVDVAECENGWYGVYDHWGDLEQGGKFVAYFRNEDDAYLYAYRKLRDVHGPITPMGGAGCPNEFLREFDCEEMTPEKE